MRECIKELSFKLSSGWSTCCQIHKPQSPVSLVRPLTLDSVWSDKDKKGWVLRSQELWQQGVFWWELSSTFHSCRACSQARELRLKYEPQCDCLISRGPGTQHLPYFVVCRVKWDAKWLHLGSVAGKCKKSAFWDNTPHMSLAIWTDQSLSVMVLLTFTKTAF